MPWFRVDDQFATSPKALLAGNAACGLWVRAGSWSAAQLTDGHIPSAIVSSLGGRAADARKLVQVGLWHSHGHDCEACPQPVRGSFLFHGWLEYQPGREEVQKKRDEARTRMATLRAGRRVRTNIERTSSEVRSPRPGPDPVPTAATAAAGGSSGSEHPSISILMSKLRSYDALSALRSDTLTARQTQQIVDLIETHGDKALVDAAVRTTGITPPRLVTAYLMTWEAMAAGRAALRSLHDPDQHRGCAECSVPKAQHRGAAFDHAWTTERSA